WPRGRVIHGLNRNRWMHGRREVALLVVLVPRRVAASIGERDSTLEGGLVLGRGDERRRRGSTAGGRGLDGCQKVTSVKRASGVLAIGPLRASSGRQRLVDQLGVAVEAERRGERNGTRPGASSDGCGACHHCPNDGVAALIVFERQHPAAREAACG